MKKTLSSLLMGAAILAPIGASAMQAFADEAPAESKSKVMAEVTSGGMAITAHDVDLGPLTISQEIPQKKVDKLLTIKDHTGGPGHEITVKSTNYEVTEPTLFSEMQVENKVSVTGEDALISSDESQLALFNKGGIIDTHWGSKPQAGNYSQDLQWTMTAKAAPVDQGDAAFDEMYNNAEVQFRFNGMSLLDAPEGSTIGNIEQASINSPFVKTPDGGYEVTVNAKAYASDKEAMEKARILSIAGGSFTINSENMDTLVTGFEQGENPLKGSNSWDAGVSSTGGYVSFGGYLEMKDSLGSNTNKIVINAKLSNGKVIPLTVNLHVTYE